jgi:hypothetical protein
MKLNLKYFMAVSAAAALLHSCSPVTMVKPLAKKEIAATATLGGPAIGFAGAVVPVPFTSIGVAYGATDKSTVTARVHTTSALFGVGHIDLGVLRQLRAQEGNMPGISVMAQGSFMFDKWQHAFRFYPQIDLNAWWDVGTKGNYVYTGAGSWFETRNQGTGGRTQSTHVIPAWNLGFSREREKWSTRFEVKYLAPFTSNQSLTVDYKAPGNSGAIGVYVGFMRKF